jgi:hypothetical protein
MGRKDIVLDGPVGPYHLELTGDPSDLDLEVEDDQGDVIGEAMGGEPLVLDVELTSPSRVIVRRQGPGQPSWTLVLDAP